MERAVGIGSGGPIVVPDGLPVPGKEFVQSTLRRLGDTAQNVGEPSLRIDIVELGGGHQKGAHFRPLKLAECHRPAQTVHAGCLRRWCEADEAVAPFARGTTTAIEGARLALLTRTPAPPRGAPRTRPGTAGFVSGTASPAHRPLAMTPPVPRPKPPGARLPPARQARPVLSGPAPLPAAARDRPGSGPRNSGCAMLHGPPPTSAPRDAASRRAPARRR